MQHSELANHLTYQAYYRLLYRDCACVHYVSPMMCELFESNTVPMPHCIVSNGVGKSFFPKSVEKPEQYRDRFVILYTGRYSREKSHKTLIDGVSRSKYRDQIQLIFAGGGPLEKELKQHAKKHLPIQPVFGFFSREEMTQLLNYADLYVHPARYEAEGIACLEAMACGNVILSSDSPKTLARWPASCFFVNRLTTGTATTDRTMATEAMPGMNSFPKSLPTLGISIAIPIPMDSNPTANPDQAPARVVPFQMSPNR